MAIDSIHNHLLGAVREQNANKNIYDLDVEIELNLNSLDGKQMNLNDQQLSPFNCTDCCRSVCSSC